MWISEIIKGILTALLGYWDVIDTRKTSQANEYRAKSREQQMESIKTAKAVQAKVQAAMKAPRPKINTGADWNRTGARAVLLLALTLALVGCDRWTKVIYVEGQRPYVPMPERPVLDANATFTPAGSAIADYALQLEAAINAYNREVHDHNVRNGFENADQRDDAADDQGPGAEPVDGAERPAEPAGAPEAGPDGVDEHAIAAAGCREDCARSRDPGRPAGIRGARQQDQRSVCRRCGGPEGADRQLSHAVPSGAQGTHGALCEHGTRGCGTDRGTAPPVCDRRPATHDARAA